MTYVCIYVYGTSTFRMYKCLLPWDCCQNDEKIEIVVRSMYFNDPDLMSIWWHGILFTS